MENNQLIEIDIKELVLKYPNYYDLGEAIVKLYEIHKESIKSL